VKCLPLSKVSQVHGLVLHDWHAEILAIRAFNHFLIQECHQLAESEPSASAYVRRRLPHEISKVEEGPQSFTIRDNLKIHMYCSEAPCGDASMELIMASQRDATPWPISAEEGEGNVLKGRGSFSELGIVRRKPCGSLQTPGLHG
jgi:tRNA-specific adenosine deaminase 1